MAEKAVLLQQTLVGTIYYRVSMIAVASCISLALDRLDAGLGWVGVLSVSVGEG